MKLARWIFRIAGIYGLLVVIPMYFQEAQVGRDYPPAITHPEYYYGFAGVTLAFQLVFLLLSTDPLRYRPIMLVGIVEKFSYAIAAIVLLLQNRIPLPMFAAGMIDLVLGISFLVAYFATAEAARRTPAMTGVGTLRS